MKKKYFFLKKIIKAVFGWLYTKTKCIKNYKIKKKNLIAYYVVRKN